MRTSARPKTQKPSPLSTLPHLKQCWEDYQKTHALKRTQQRDGIVDIFFRSQHHVSIEDLLKRVRQKHPKIGYVTIYRTMKLLLAAGLAEARQFGDGQTRYEVTSPDLPHHDHLICLQCGLILEFENDEIEKLQVRMAQKLGGFTIVHHKLELYGLCPRARGVENGACPSLK